jgi:hypothetical protein
MPRWLYMYPQSWYCSSRRYIRKGIGFHKERLGIIGYNWLMVVGNFLPEQTWCADSLSTYTKMVGFIKFSQIKLFGRYCSQHLEQDQSGSWEILVGAFMVLKESYIKILVKLVYVFGWYWSLLSNHFIR